MQQPYRSQRILLLAPIMTAVLTACMQDSATGPTPTNPNLLNPAGGGSGSTGNTGDAGNTGGSGNTAGSGNPGGSGGSGNLTLTAVPTLPDAIPPLIAMQDDGTQRSITPTEYIQRMVGSTAAETKAAAQMLLAADFHTVSTPTLANGQIELTTLSTMPDTVSNGDVLVALRGVKTDTFTVKTRKQGDSQTTDQTAAFKRQANGDLHGLIKGLALGLNEIEASDGAKTVVMTVKNHPITGPIISGPHQPFFCKKLDDDPEYDSKGILDVDNCTRPTLVRYYYRSRQSQSMVQFNPGTLTAYPNDTDTTVTHDNKTVPFVVRVETSTINRGITQLAVLDDPIKRGKDKPFDAANWNRRAYFVYGESCGTGYNQGRSDPTLVLGSIDPQKISGDRLLINVAGVGQRLAKGDIIINSTLTTFGVHCNPFISMETTLMIKEYITENYGLIKTTIGTNGSGAALQQYNAANNAPGLLSAAMPSATFADIPSTAMTVTDCGLLNAVYRKEPDKWNGPKRAAINGHLPYLTGPSQFGPEADFMYDQGSICGSWENNFLSRVRVESCDGAIPSDRRWNATTNPTGIRCGIQDTNVNSFGVVPSGSDAGKARRPLDNTGVQYGLQALIDGAISPEEFVELNEKIGGYDLEGKAQKARMVMDEVTERRTYGLGGVIGRGKLHEIPILDFGIYLDLVPSANIHEAVRPFTVRERLQRHRKQKATMAMWRGVMTQPDGFDVMDKWLDNIAAGKPGFGSDRQKLVTDSKPLGAPQGVYTAGVPNGASDSCVIGSLGGRLDLPGSLYLPLGVSQAPLLPVPSAFPATARIGLPDNFMTPNEPSSVCAKALPVTRTPRMVAGMPLRDDIIKCQLKPLDFAKDYGGKTFTDDQKKRLAAVFSTGVCNYAEPAVGELVTTSMTWPTLGTTEQSARQPLTLIWRAVRSK